jgi:hypothetical protein
VEGRAGWEGLGTRVAVQIIYRPATTVRLLCLNLNLEVGRLLRWSASIAARKMDGASHARLVVVQVSLDERTCAFGSVR